MRRIIRPATFMLATALLTLAACASPTAPTRNVKASVPTMESGFTVGVGVKPATASGFTVGVGIKP